MVRVCIGLGLVACVFAILQDASACHRRRCRSSCPSTHVCEAVEGTTSATETGGVTTKSTTKSTTTTTASGPTAEEMRWWESMVKKEYVTKDQFDDLWKNSTSAERKKFYDNILKVEKDAAEKAEKELKQKEKLENPKSKKEDLEAKAPPAPASMVVTLPADARLSVQGQALSTVSTSRLLISPALERGKTFVYTIQAEIVRDGWSLTQTQQVIVRGGETTYVPFRFSPNEVAAR